MVKHGIANKGGLYLGLFTLSELEILNKLFKEKK